MPTVDGAPPPPEAVETPATAEVPCIETPSSAIGLAGETVVWEGRYSFRNFLGRITLGVALTIAWFVLAVANWGYGYQALLPLTLLVGLGGLVFWVLLLNRMAQARLGHAYRLTNRRLLVATGLLRRREDQLELLRVKDVFTRQTLLERWMSLGTVVVVPEQKELPVFYVTGVEDPQAVMDRIWHHTRTERDLHSKADAV
jgi:membrane protein YdbS with pleckstrin-like domain